MIKHSLLSLILTVFVINCFGGIVRGHGTWIYDAIYDDAGNRIGVKPGLFATNIYAYNKPTDPLHQLTLLYSYGGFIKMFCQGSGGTSPSTPCTPDTLKVYYNSDSTAAYYNTVNCVSKVTMSPIVDGQIGETFLKNFNTMDQATAEMFADNVAKTYCADNLVSGVQFNLEIFDMTQPGQAYFYRQIAKNFAGKHNPTGPDPFGCVNASHPTGRFFSIFTASRRIDETTAQILNQYGNGYAIITLYSLNRSTGQATPPATFEIVARNEVKKMIAKGQLYNLKYQFGIPGAATLQEFESVNHVTSGYTQLKYVMISLDLIDQYARNEPNFLGVSLWSWSSRRIKNGDEYEPPYPPANVREYIRKYL